VAAAFACGAGDSELVVKKTGLSKGVADGVATACVTVTELPFKLEV